MHPFATKENHLKKFMSLFSATTLLLFPITVQAAPNASVPLYKVTVVQSSAKAINYRYLKSSTMIGFKGTVLLAAASGEAEVKSKAGATEIDATFDHLSAASQFGPEYLTYVLWAISPEGRATNLGELIVKNEKSELKVTEQLQSFGLIVTAEPYFAVSQPSNVVVMENVIRKDTAGKVEAIDAKYELLQRGQYTTNVVPSDLQPTVIDKKTPFAVYQARNAVRIAKAAGAETYAPEAYAKSAELLAQSETKEGGKKGRAMTAREAVQSAEDARLITIKRQEVEALDKERQMSADQVSQANTKAAMATADKTLAEAAQARAAQGQVLAEAGKAQAEQAKGQAESDRANAMDQVRQAEVDKAGLRAQLLQQLNSILQTRDSARGLIVNMSGVLFETGKSTLLPGAREKLAKIAGIVLAHPRLRLEVEGHTDSVGTDAANQTLSEKRADAARTYLVSQGVVGDSIVSRGLGKANPIGSNDTNEGRQQNRRVELIVSGAGITTPNP
jgi:outer membrane protein OmpA-like peptidoglycan-associated protein